MAKDGSADTAVGVAKIIPKEHYFTFKFVNLLTIASTDYMVIANEFKKLVLLYDAKLLVYDANGVGAGIRDWLNKETRDESGAILEGLGIINPPSSTEKDVISYPKSKTICYEIKSGGKIGEQIH
nr:MAG TPA: terminase large subunit [Caudoviricetes sp.]